MKLRGFVPTFHIHVYVSDLYIPTIGPPILLQLTDTGMQEFGTRPHSFISGNICFEFSVQCLFNVA